MDGDQTNDKPAAGKSKVIKAGRVTTAKTVASNGKTGSNGKTASNGHAQGLGNRQLLGALRALQRGEFDVRLPDDFAGVDGQLATTFNELAQFAGSLRGEIVDLRPEVGIDGKLGAQARIRGVSGVWKELTDSVNLMASNLTDQVREIAQVTTAVAQGDLTKTVNIEAKGEILQLKNTINTMVDQLGSF